MQDDDDGGGEDWFASCTRIWRPLFNCGANCCVFTFVLTDLIFCFLMTLMIFRLLRGDDAIWGRAAGEFMLTGLVIALCIGLTLLIVVLCTCTGRGGRRRSKAPPPPQRAVSAAAPAYEGLARRTIISY
jgi:hypothetical protein